MDILIQIIIGVVSVGATVWAAMYGVNKAFEIHRRALATQHEENEAQRKAMRDESAAERLALEEKDRADKAGFKKWFTISMLAEMQKIYQMLYNNQGSSNIVYINDRFDTTAIFDSIESQATLFTNHDLASGLAEMRSEVKRILGIIGPSSTAADRSNWNSYNSQTRRSLEKVRKLLASEYPGPVDELPELCRREWI